MSLLERSLISDWLAGLFLDVLILAALYLHLGDSITIALRTFCHHFLFAHALYLVTMM